MFWASGSESGFSVEVLGFRICFSRCRFFGFWDKFRGSK